MCVYELSNALVFHNVNNLSLVIDIICAASNSKIVLPKHIEAVLFVPEKERERKSSHCFIIICFLFRFSTIFVSFVYLCLPLQHSFSRRKKKPHTLSSAFEIFIL